MKVLIVSIIEIKHENNFDLKYFLEVNEDIEKEDPISIYMDKFSYILHFPKDNNASLQLGKIKLITNIQDIWFIINTI